MRIQCPHCHGYHTRPAPYRWFELPLALFLLQPYLCYRCERRFVRFRWPELSFGPPRRSGAAAR
jgi:hypothetical protein